MGICHSHGLLEGSFGRFGTHCGGKVVMYGANVDVFVSVGEEGAGYVRVMCGFWETIIGKRHIQWEGGRGVVESLSQSKRA